MRLSFGRGDAVVRRSMRLGLAGGLAAAAAAAFGAACGGSGGAGGSTGTGPTSGTGGAGASCVCMPDPAEITSDCTGAVFGACELPPGQGPGAAVCEDWSGGLAASQCPLCCTQGNPGAVFHLHKTCAELFPMGGITLNTTGACQADFGNPSLLCAIHWFAENPPFCFKCDTCTIGGAQCIRAGAGTGTGGSCNTASASTTATSSASSASSSTGGGSGWCYIDQTFGGPDAGSDAGSEAFHLCSTPESGICGTGYSMIGACPTMGLVGCCKMPGPIGEVCTYDDATFLGYTQMSCTMQGGTWQTSP